MNKFLRGSTIVSLAALITTAGMATANAGGRNGVCELGRITTNNGEGCFHYNSKAYGLGSLWDNALQAPDVNSFTENKLDQGRTYYFISNGEGKGRPVKNHAAAATNGVFGLTMAVYLNSGWKGNIQYIAYGNHDLNPTLKNDNASYRWFS